MIIRTKRYITELKEILRFIAKDSLNNSRKFKNELDSKIDQIPIHPLIYRKSITANDENIRDLIYKGYTIPYKIKDDEVYILGIYKHNLWKA